MSEALWPTSAFMVLFVAYCMGGRLLLILVGVIGIYLFKVMSD